MSEHTVKTDLDEKDLHPSIFTIIKKIYNFVAKVILYSIIMAMLFMGVLFVTYSIDYMQNISKGNYKPLYGAYIIVSPSMVPAIHVQDAVIVKNVAMNRLRKGDIITFTSTDSRYSGLIVTHRIIDIEKNEDGKYLFRTKGDSNNSPDDALVTEDNIHGRVFVKIPKIGYLQSFLSHSYGWIICVVIPCLALIAYEILRIIQATRDTVVKKVSKKNNQQYKTKKQRKKHQVEVIANAKDKKTTKEKEEIEIISLEDENNKSKHKN